MKAFSSQTVEILAQVILNKKILENTILWTFESLEVLAYVANSVTPAKAGVQSSHFGMKRLDSGFRRNDDAGLLQKAP